MQDCSCCGDLQASDLQEDPTTCGSEPLNWTRDRCKKAASREHWHSAFDCGHGYTQEEYAMKTERERESSSSSSNSSSSASASVSAELLLLLLLLITVTYLISGLYTNLHTFLRKKCDVGYYVINHGVYRIRSC